MKVNKSTTYTLVDDDDVVIATLPFPADDDDNYVIVESDDGRIVNYLVHDESGLNNYDAEVESLNLVGFDDEAQMQAWIEYRELADDDAWSSHPDDWTGKVAPQAGLSRYEWGWQDESQTLGVARGGRWCGVTVDASWPDVPSWIESVRDTYQKCLDGDVWGIVRVECDKAGNLLEWDSVWGFIGYDHAVEMMNDTDGGFFS